MYDFLDVVASHVNDSHSPIGLKSFSGIVLCQNPISVAQLNAVLFFAEMDELSNLHNEILKRREVQEVWYVDRVSFLDDGSEVLQKYRVNGRFDWDSFRDDYGGSQGILWISKPVFSLDSTKVFIKVEQKYLDHPGRGFEYYFSKNENGFLKYEIKKLIWDEDKDPKYQENGSESTFDF